MFHLNPNSLTSTKKKVDKIVNKRKIEGVEFETVGKSTLDLGMATCEEQV